MTHLQRVSFAGAEDRCQKTKDKKIKKLERGIEGLASVFYFLQLHLTF